MKVLRAITATCVALIATALPAFETECVPGSLPTALREHRNISTLVLSGSADASDLFFIADSLPTLTDLDISGISIAAYHGKRLKGNTVYPEDAIPAGTFGGTKLQRVIHQCRRYGIRLDSSPFNPCSGPDKDWGRCICRLPHTH